NQGAPHRRRVRALPDRNAGSLRGARRSGAARTAQRPGDCARLRRPDTRPPDVDARNHMTAPRFQLADELLRRFAAALRSAQLYSKGHPIIARNLESLSAAAQLLHTLEPSIVVGIVGEEVIVDDLPVAKADTLGPLMRRLQQSGV